MEPTRKLSPDLRDVIAQYGDHPLVALCDDLLDRLTEKDYATLLPTLSPEEQRAEINAWEKREAARWDVIHRTLRRRTANEGE